MVTGMTSEEDYRTVRVPTALIKEIEQCISENPSYVSLSDFIKEALRTHLRTVQGTTKAIPV